MPSLASLLTRDAVVPIELIERALERQTLEGGELDTALLELDSAPENVLAAYRAATFRLDAVGRGELLRIEAAVLACVPAKLAQHLQVVPIAMQEGTLIVAGFLPLSEDARRQLESASTTEVDLRIATEARITAALERHYSVTMSERMRKLVGQLDVRNPGALVNVDPDRPSKRFTPPPPMHVPSSIHRTQRLGGIVAGPPGDAPVQVTRVVELAERAREIGHAETQDATETRPMRPSRLPGRKSDSLDRDSSSLVDRALLSRLTAAPDRAAVEDAMLLHIAERFACSVLFEVRDKHLMGRTAIGLQAGLDARSIEAPMSRGLQAIVLAGQARVLDLLRDCPGDSLPALIDRMSSQPCAVLPIAFSKRVVIAVYADRAGKPIDESEIDALAPALAAAGQALERILHDRKVGALEARRSIPYPSSFPMASDSDSPVRESRPGGAKGAGGHTEIGISPSQSPNRTAAGIGGGSVSGSVYKQREIDSELSEAALRSLAPARSTERPPPLAAAPDESEATPTVVMPRASDKPSPSASASQSEPPVERAADRAPTPPGRPSSLPPRDGPARLLSHPPKGAGSYAMRDLDEPEEEPRGSRVPQHPSLGHAAREEVVQRGQSRPEQDPRRASPRESVRDNVRETARENVHNKRRQDAPTVPRDPRRDGNDRAMRADFVSIAPAVRESLRPAAAQDEAGALNIDLTGEADRLVDRLAASTPGEETPLVSALVRLGQAGVDALVRRFPGPSWVPRGQLHKRVIAGRDLGPLPRALWAFDDEMIPAVQELLEAQHADARSFAAVLAGDRVHPDLLWPLYRRLFDPEGAVRLLVSETLPLYRHAQGFDDVLKSLRKRAGDQRETLQNRLAALEAVASLRDVGSIDVLADLAGHTDRQYSLPAQRALISITGQDFGDATRKWKAWHSKNARLNRAQWLIESLMHSEEKVRASAGNELQRLTQVYYGFTASAPKRDRERAQDRYRAWWEQEGKAQFGNR
jgi:hypothetical protein